MGSAYQSSEEDHRELTESEDSDYDSEEEGYQDSEENLNS